MRAKVGKLGEYAVDWISIVALTIYSYIVFLQRGDLESEAILTDIRRTHKDHNILFGYRKMSLDLPCQDSYLIDRKQVRILLLINGDKVNLAQRANYK